MIASVPLADFSTPLVCGSAQSAPLDPSGEIWRVTGLSELGRPFVIAGPLPPAEARALAGELNRRSIGAIRNRARFSCV